ncbi:MAG: class I SAM-dependent methyltransferase [Nitrospirae bacterium]|nr:MAG: class I SAM-dependent methyltransferase [Nitrospirota bacterium]
MLFIGNLVKLLARSFKTLGDFFDRLSNLLNSFLPALLSPGQLNSLVKGHYRTVQTETWLKTDLDWKEDCCLDPSETEILDRYRITSGKMLVLGSGWGREAIAIARRGVAVVGIDTNFAALRTAQELVKSTGVSACFHQGDFLALPYVRSSFDCALLASRMYSAIPGISHRHAWLADLGRLLKPNGLAILSFLPNRHTVSRLRRVCAQINGKIVTLPGANTAYQPGDDWLAGHFWHWFQDKDEIRKELDGAGVTILEINWAKGMAVVAYPPRIHAMS